MAWRNRSAQGSSGFRPLGSPTDIKRLAPRGFTRIWQFRAAEPSGEAELANRGPLFRDRKLAQVEAVLFLMREPLTSRKIAQIANLADGTEARKLVRRLKLLLDEGGSAFQIAEVAGGYRLLTRPEFSPWIRQLLQSPGQTRLSAPAMETLAVVAYRQPILRAEIEAIRGVQCDDILRQLLDRDLIRIIGRSEDLGRPLLYGTTRRFLELFGLKNLEELPRASRATAAVNRPTIETPDSNPSTTETNPGTGQAAEITTDSIPEEKSVTTCIRNAKEQTQDLAEGLALVANSPRLRPATKPISAAKDEDEDEEEEDDEDEDWDDDDDEEDEDLDDEEDDDFVDEDWEEVDDDDEEDEDEEDEEDEDWEDDEEEDWDDDEDEDEDWEDDDSE